MTSVSVPSISASRRVEIQGDSVSSQTLLSGQGHLLIQHADSCYQLRRTAAGKLILTREPGFGGRK
ncbi:MAG: hemin uptake protein HemP [Alcanivoracaceae bacterium]|nr:hemin uptake protein HemP [Alcanivoracaceae bacterium]